jgi:DNA-nicking Smr family endonuclease
MPRKRKPSRPNPKRPSTKPIFVSPFKVLKKMIRENARTAYRPESSKGATSATAAVKDSVPASLDDATLLSQAFEGVRPLAGSGSGRVPLDPRVNRSIVSEDSEVLAELHHIVSGQGKFDITETEEYVEGSRVGLDPRLVTRLRKGEFAVQAHTDLHGMTQEAAKEALNRFILDSVHKGLRIVLVVHGRGRGSPGGRPVLKHAAVIWLSQGALSGYVLAFVTARPADGGAGAIYVLLRRDRRRAPFEVLEGAKRRD